MNEFAVQLEIFLCIPHHFLDANSRFFLFCIVLEWNGLGMVLDGGLPGKLNEKMWVRRSILLLGEYHPNKNFRLFNFLSLRTIYVMISTRPTKTHVFEISTSETIQNFYPFVKI